MFDGDCASPSTSVRRLWRATAVRAVAALMTLAASRTAAGQTTAPPPAQPVAGWNEGFFLQTPNGDNRLQIGFVGQTDGRFALDNPLPTINTFVLRKARPTFTGRVAKYFDFKFTAELAGSPTLLDAYFDIRFSPKLRLRSGKDKTPVGYELLINDPALVFPERSLVSLLVPNRDVGFQAQGDLADGKLVYAGGIFNGNPVDGQLSTADVDVNSGKDLAGRVVFYPFRSASEPHHALANFGFHLGGSTGDQSGPLPTFRTTTGQTLFAFPASVTADGTRNRVSPAVFLYAKGFGGFAEYARTTQDVLSSGTPLTVTNQAWGVTATYVLTGESTSERGVKPSRPFDPAAGTWGAVQVAARYAELTLDGLLFDSGIGSTTASRTTQQMTFDTNWYLNNYVKFYGTFEHLDFSGTRVAENLIIFRAQLAF